MSTNPPSDERIDQIRALLAALKEVPMKDQVAADAYTPIRDLLARIDADAERITTLKAQKEVLRNRLADVLENCRLNPDTLASKVLRAFLNDLDDDGLHPEDFGERIATILKGTHHA